MTTYETIRSLRLLSHMSQEELARRAGYNDRSSIAKIEAGKVDLTESKILTFARIFHTTPSQLMGLSEVSEYSVQRLSSDEMAFLREYRNLNDTGRKKLQDYSQDLLKIADYLAPKS